MKKTIKEFLKALEDGYVCLHPTDTIPGLTFHPALNKSSQTTYSNLELLESYKQRSGSKPFIALVDQFETATRFWEPLPPKWDDFLKKIWPAPISFIWLASDTVPPRLLGADGTLALRSPKLPESHEWFREVLRLIKLPLPTTSVNLSGESPACTIKDAVKMLSGQKGFFVADALKTAHEEARPTSPSSVVKIQGDGSYHLVREGLVSLDSFASMARQFGL